MPNRVWVYLAVFHMRGMAHWSIPIPHSCFLHCVYRPVLQVLENSLLVKNLFFSFGGPQCIIKNEGGNHPLLLLSSLCKYNSQWIKWEQVQSLQPLCNPGKGKPKCGKQRWPAGWSQWVLMAPGLGLSTRTTCPLTLSFPYIREPDISWSLLTFHQLIVSEIA